jgi:hypothetical protein
MLGRLSHNLIGQVTITGVKMMFSLGTHRSEVETQIPKGIFGLNFDQ